LIWPSLTQAKLTRMGLKHRAKFRDYDELYQVEFSQIEVSPDTVRLRIDVDSLPEGVTTTRIRDDAVLTDLSHALGHPVSYDGRVPSQGCWLIIHLGEKDRIPTYVPFGQFIQSYPDNPKPLTIPIGHGLMGPMWRDLRELPHLLVAGATGKGKSVMIHSIIATLLHLPPNRLKLVLCDLKGGMTLGKYKKVPHHHRALYVRRAEELPRVLLALQEEMQSRVETMENIAEDIDEWNKLRPQKWPYILLVIEELANAMLSKERVKLGKHTETVAAATDRLLADLAARGRAAGVHIIATTQSPRADVINGLIKANFPARIAFGTASDMDSRVIIDDSRAQGLAKGRAILLDCADYYELQAPYLSEEDRAKILKATLAGEHWLEAHSKEARLIADVRLLLTVAERDMRGLLDLEELLHVPDVKQARLTPDRIKECMSILLADKVIAKRPMLRGYRVVMGRRAWNEQYPERKIELSQWDATIQPSKEDIIEGEVVNGNSEPIQAPGSPTSTPIQTDSGSPVVSNTRLLGDMSELQRMILRWNELGYSRREMKKRMGMDWNKAARIIIETLGPATSYSYLRQVNAPNPNDPAPPAN
jgi:hypothetical protein